MTHESDGSPAGDADLQKLREQLDKTRAALASKLNLLQQRVTNSVDSACNTVDNTLHAGKQSAQNALHAVKCALNLKQQTTRYPWTLLGAATCVGALLLRRNQTRSQSTKTDSIDHPFGGEIQPRSESNAATSAQLKTLRTKQTIKHWLSTRAKHEMSKLQSAAIAAGVSFLRSSIDRLSQRLKNKTPDNPGDPGK